MQLDRGYLSHYFITDQDRRECVLEDALVLVTDKKISAMKDILTILEGIAKSGRSLMIICDDLEGEPLATLVVNRIRGVLKVCAIKAPGYGDRRKEILQDIAILTGAQLVCDEAGLKLEKCGMEVLGTVKRLVCDKDTTTFAGGGGVDEAIKARIVQLKGQIENSDSDFDRVKLQERLAKLTGGVAVIRVGAATETEMKAKKAKIEDAKNATKAGIEEGILPGGGTALLRAARALDSVRTNTADEATGVDIVRRALPKPLQIIVKNAGEQPSVVIDRLLNGDKDVGFNAETMQYCYMVKDGIVDPCKVTRSALENAASIASTLLTTECLIADQEEDSCSCGGHHPATVRI